MAKQAASLDSLDSFIVSQNIIAVDIFLVSPLFPFFFSLSAYFFLMCFLCFERVLLFVIRIAYCGFGLFFLPDFS